MKQFKLGLPITVGILALMLIHGHVQAQENGPFSPIDQPPGNAMPKQGFGGPGHGQGNKGGPQQGMGRPGQMIQELGLTDEQKNKMKALMQGRRENMQSKQQALQAKRQQLMQMMKDGSGSKEKALALHKEISQGHAAMMEQRIAMLYDMKAILTPEQFAKFRSKMQERMQNQGGGPRTGNNNMGQGGPGGAGGMGMGKGGRTFKERFRNRLDSIRAKNAGTQHQ